MGNTVLGVVAPLPQGAWNSTTTYQKLSVVREGNSSYIAKSANVNIQPGVTDSWETYWMLLNEDGDRGQPGQQGETGVGVPDGGLKGDLLVKRSQANYDDEWVDPDNITVGNATKAVQDENGNNIADTYQTKQEATTQNTALQTQITSNTQGITQNSQLISRNSARLTNLEQRISPSPFVTDSTVAYVKDVPENALPYAELQKLGGMTRKCTNLLPATEGYTYTITADGANNQKMLFENFYLIAGTYTISFDITAGGTNNRNTPTLKKVDGTDTVYFNTTTNAYIDAGHYEKNAVVSSSGYYNFVWWDNGGTVSQTVSNLMLNEGATALPYEPYFEGLRSAPVTSVESVGANLIPFPYNSNSGIINGVTITVNNNGSITLKGTATKTFNYTIFSDNTLEGIGVKEGETLWVSSGGATVSFGVYDVTDGVTYNSERSFTVDITHIYRIRINIGIGESVDTTVYPMLNKGSTALPYAPYTKSTLPIPEAVQALDGYGEGNPDDPTEYNSIQWDKKGNCSYSHKGNIVNNEWVPLSNEIVTGISALITADNLLPVQGNGTITFVNEYGYAVPSTVEYMT